MFSMTAWRRWIWLVVLVAGCAAEPPAVEPEPEPPPSRLTVPADQTLARATKDLIAQLSLGKYAEARSLFDDAMLRALSTERLEALWVRLVREHGGFKGVLHHSETDLPPLTAIVATCLFQRKQIGFRVLFNAERQITGLYLVPAEPPPPPRGIAATGPLAELAQKLIAELSQGQHQAVRATFDDALRAAVSDEQLAALWAQLIAEHGQLESVLHQSRWEKKPLTAIVSTCQLERDKLGIRLVFDAQQKVAGLFFVPPEPKPVPAPPTKVQQVLSRPQTPKPPLPYGEREVRFDGPKDQPQLGGTLTLPKSDPPFPAALLIAGPAAPDRDATIFGHKPLRVIADRLTKAGLMVLRADSRPAGQSPDDEAAALEARAAEALAGLSFLKQQPDIDPKKIGLLGWHEGALIAARLASQQRDVAFVISLGGAGLPAAEGAADPRKAWAKVTCPVLVLIGDKDTEVPFEPNLKALGAALLSGGNKDYALKAPPGLNHLFQRSETGSPDEYAAIEQTFDPGTLELMAGWFRAKVLGSPLPPE